MTRPLQGRTVALAEGRQLAELAEMLEKDGATALRCPMVSILDAPDPAPVVAWLRELAADRFGYVVLLTGEGLRRLLGFAEREGLRIQLRDRGIAVTTLCPGFVKTPMTAVNTFKMPFLLEADEAARRMVRALHRRRKVYNFPWQTTLLMKLTRWLPDWLMAKTMKGYNTNPPPPVGF